MSRYQSDADRVTLNVSVDEASGCWNWMRYRHPSEGYGYLRLAGRRMLAHRLAYETFVGPIPEGLDIDHLCRNRACVNPDHLEPVTRRENILRSPIARAARNARKTHCPKGHEYSPENTYYAPSCGRLCRTCQRTRRDRAAFRAAGIEVAA